MRPRVWLLAALAALAVVAVLGCRDRATTETAPKNDLPTVDVAPAPDAALSISEDAIAKPYESAGGLSGALPEGFPKDVPVFLPASLVDSRSTSDGSFSLTLDASRPTAEVEAGQRALLERAGWSVDEGRYRKQGRRVTVTFEARPTGTRFVVSYSPPVA